MSKYFLKSKTVIGSLVLILGAFGVTLPVGNDEIEEILVLVEKLLGFALVIYGRLRASQPLYF